MAKTSHTAKTGLNLLKSSATKKRGSSAKSAAITATKGKATRAAATKKRADGAKSKIGSVSRRILTRSVGTKKSGTGKANPVESSSQMVPPRASTQSGGKKATRPVSPMEAVSSPASTFPTEILQDYRIYRQLQNALVRLMNQIKAIQKHDPMHGALLPLQEMLLAGRKPYKETEKSIVGVVRKLEIWTWAKDVRGVAENSLGQLLGETGDLSNYSNPSKLWKRMGLGLVGGHRQQFWAANRKGFTKTENVKMATDMGYSARRRSLMHVIGSNLIRAKNKEYGELYRERKKLEMTKLPDKDPITGKKNKSRKSHAHARALRYIEKRFLLNLWKQWRAAWLMIPVEKAPAAGPQIQAAD